MAERLCGVKPFRQVFISTVPSRRQGPCSRGRHAIHDTFAVFAPLSGKWSTCGTRKRGEVIQRKRETKVFQEEQTTRRSEGKFDGRRRADNLQVK